MNASLSVSNIAWSGEEAGPYLKAIKACGGHGVEIAASLVWEEPLVASSRMVASYREYVESFGLRVSGLASLLYSRPDLQLLASGKGRNDALDYLRRTIDLCVSLGGTYVVLGRPVNRRRGNLTKEEANHRARSILSELSSHALKQGCTIGLEALPKPECDFITDLRECRDLVQSIRSAGIELHLDTGAAEGSKDFLIDKNTLRQLLELAGSCQINDYELLPPGSTHPELHDLWAELLLDVRYNGWISIEMRRSKNPKEAISKAIAFAFQKYANVLQTHNR